MFTLLICIVISKTLTFAGLTLPTLFAWFCHHPFLFIIMLNEIFATSNSFITFNVNNRGNKLW